MYWRYEAMASVSDKELLHHKCMGTSQTYNIILQSEVLYVVQQNDFAEYVGKQLQGLLIYTYSAKFKSPQENCMNGSTNFYRQLFIIL